VLLNVSTMLLIVPGGMIKRNLTFAMMYDDC
jgi:hypothetical protein